MTKLMEIDIDLTPEDIVEYIINADSQEQSSILYKLSKVHYNEVGKFLIQLQSIVDDIKNSYNHDIQNNIKRMVDDLHGYICEGDLK